MSNEASISETLQAILRSATITAADSDMHVQVRLHRNGLLVAVNSAAASDERLIPWEEIERAADLEVMVSSETLVAVEKVRRSA